MRRQVATCGRTAAQHDAARLRFAEERFEIGCVLLKRPSNWGRVMRGA